VAKHLQPFYIDDISETSTECITLISELYEKHIKSKKCTHYTHDLSEGKKRKIKGFNQKQCTNDVIL